MTVTRDQLARGYFEQMGPYVRRHEFVVLRDNGDGTFMVEDPTRPQWPRTDPP